MKKIAVYTAIFGDYDKLITPVHFDKLVQEADFFCYTDDPSLTSEIYTIRHVRKPHVDPVKSNRHYKILSHRYFSEYDFVLYVDANVKIVCDSFWPIIKRYLRDSSFAVFKHPSRNCLYQESLWVLSNQKIDSAIVVKEQMERYKMENFPSEFGLSAGTFLFRRTADKAVIEFCELWWKEVEKGSRRDQLSFDYVRWKTGMHISYMTGSWDRNFLGIVRPHFKNPSRNISPPEPKRKWKLKRIIRKIKSVLLQDTPRKPDPMAVEIKRLKAIPNDTIFETTLLGPPIKSNHSGSFLFLYKELFQEGVYEFKTDNDRPFIIDCGVNIGMSIIYFKKRFPNAEIIGFEPDPELYLLAKQNFEKFKFSDITLLQKGVWKEEGVISFYSEGTDAGRIALKEDFVNLKQINTIRLSTYINRNVDFLKIDIEGAELAVLEECASKLHFVRQMFVEYHAFINEEQNLSKLLSILENTGFRYSISTPKVLNKKPYSMDTNYLGMNFLLNIYAYR